MEPSREIEFYYAERLRTSTREERVHLYEEAYSAATKHMLASFPSSDPEQRTAGTTRSLVSALPSLCSHRDRILEVGCGRGYTVLGLAPYVREIVGVDVSEPSLQEATQLLAKHRVQNATILKARADDLTSHFDKNSFDMVISIDVYEHLHPEDGAVHLAHVYDVLKPGGIYVVVTPNGCNGPHDITRQEFPDERVARGFHLNETTYAQLVSDMKSIGFGRFRRFLWFPQAVRPFVKVSYPVTWQIWFERLFCFCRDHALEWKGPVLNKLLGISLIARKAHG